MQLPKLDAGSKALPNSRLQLPKACHTTCCLLPHLKRQSNNQCRCWPSQLKRQRWADRKQTQHQNERAMNWTEKQRELTDNQFTCLAEALSEEAYAAGTSAPLSHPVALLLSNISEHRVATAIRETELALSNICRWLDSPVGSKHRGWYESKLRSLAQDTPNAAGALGEIRGADPATAPKA